MRLPWLCFPDTQKPMSRSPLSLAISIAAAVLATACVRGKDRDQEPAKTSAPSAAYAGDELPPVDQQGTPQPGGTLRVAMEAEPPSLNFQLDPLDAWGKRLHELVYNNMARPNPKTWEHEPELAERWEVSDDRLTFTFYLRRGVKWHDGEPFGADDVIFTFTTLLNPTVKAMAMRTFLEPIEKIEKVDAFTVRFKLKRPYWLAFDAIAEIYIYPQHVFAKGDFNTHPANRAPVGTGPFRFVHWRTGDEVLYERNPEFFGGMPHLERIVFKYVPDPTVRLQMVRRGEIDLVMRLTPQAWKSIGEDRPFAESFWRLRHVPSSLQWVGWNNQRPMFQDPRVRRALTMLLDRDDIVQNLRLGLDSPTVSWFYPGAKEYNDKIEPWPYDPKAAAELLAQAGWRDTDGDGLRDRDGAPFTFTFSYPANSPFYEQLAGLMAGEFRQAGIEVKTARLEWAVFTERLRQHEFDACSLLWQVEPRTDPYQIWHSSAAAGGSNFIAFANREADELLVAARAEFDEEKRTAMYRRFSEILHEQEPYTLLFNRYNLSLVSKQFGGLYSTPYGILRLDEIYRVKGP